MSRAGSVAEADASASSFGHTESCNDTSTSKSVHVQDTADSYASALNEPAHSLSEPGSQGAQLSAEWRNRRRIHEWRLHWLQCRLTALSASITPVNESPEGETTDRVAAECARCVPFSGRAGARRKLHSAAESAKNAMTIHQQEYNAAPTSLRRFAYHPVAYKPVPSPAYGMHFLGSFFSPFYLHFPLLFGMVHGWSAWQCQP